MGNTLALHAAVVNRKADEVRKLINRGDDVNVLDKKGNNCLALLLTCAIERGEKILSEEEFQLVSMLVRAGISINNRNEEGISAMHFAAQLYDVELIQLFIKNGGSPCLRTKLGLTPMDALSNPQESSLPPTSPLSNEPVSMNTLVKAEELSPTSPSSSPIMSESLIEDPSDPDSSAVASEGDGKVSPENSAESLKQSYDLIQKILDRSFLIQNTSLFNVIAPPIVIYGEEFSVTVTSEQEHSEEDSIQIYQVSTPPWRLRPLLGASRHISKGEFVTIRFNSSMLVPGKSYRVLYTESTSGNISCASSLFWCIEPEEPETKPEETPEAAEGEPPPQTEQKEVVDLQGDVDFQGDVVDLQQDMKKLDEADIIDLQEQLQGEKNSSERESLEKEKEEEKNEEEVEEEKQGEDQNSLKESSESAFDDLDQDYDAYAVYDAAYDDEDYPKDSPSPEHFSPSSPESLPPITDPSAITEHFPSSPTSLPPISDPSTMTGEALFPSHLQSSTQPRSTSPSFITSRSPSSPKRSRSPISFKSPRTPSRSRSPLSFKSPRTPNRSQTPVFSKPRYLSTSQEQPPGLQSQSQPQNLLTSPASSPVIISVQAKASEEKKEEKDERKDMEEISL